MSYFIFERSIYLLTVPDPICEEAAQFLSASTQVKFDRKSENFTLNSYSYETFLLIASEGFLILY
jgi:hypothetical protein